MIYLDYSANTPVSEDVLRCFCETEREFFGNPNSTHDAGKAAKERMDEITVSIAGLMGAAPEEMIYTSCASESNNTALKGIAALARSRGMHIISTALEHSSVGGCLTALQEQGFERYEISNYAKPGKECRHNIGYWTEVAYLGLGLGASSLLDHMRFSNTADMKEYIGNSAFPDKIRQNMESLTEADEMAEFMFLGLRMTEGVSMEAFAEYFGKNMENVYGEVLKKHLEIGMLEQKGDRIYLSRKGIHVSNGVMADFLL